MPLTFAHPAAILPFSRKSRYIHFSAMVLGSMAPDFEYFLRGRPIGEIGHTLIGFFLFNLPLVILIYFIYHRLIHQNLINHLPAFLQDTYSHQMTGSITWKVVVFGYSAILGMLTHVLWDSFTHQNGFMVTNFPLLSQTYTLYGYQIPFYKLLQHGSTLVGSTLIFGYLYYRASFIKNNNTPAISPKQKFFFWLLVVVLTLVYTSLWQLINYESFSSYGIVVVRIIDSFFCSVLTLSLFFSYRQKQRKG
ncbi:DUF4184 family protein [Lysinibacillus cavernae]|uniref:DUF4184 family protein n=1 Tax=Lysinibacillus cavernae TaxID=2666135 RepID=UPI0012D9EFAC|nr:DUF4184 family protein [Lysinibacillus cavernae]